MRGLDKLKRKYVLKDGSIYWHRLYFDLLPNILTEYSPPLGNYNYGYYLIRPDKYVIAIYDQVKWFIQRGIRGWADYDAWGWCTHHAKVNLDVLKWLQKHKHGYPLGMREKTWDKRLQQMIDGFQAFMDEENDVTSYKKLSRTALIELREERYKKLKLGLKYFRQHYCDLWD